jgi:hypothetical protein
MVGVDCDFNKLSRPSWDCHTSGGRNILNRRDPSQKTQEQRTLRVFKRHFERGRSEAAARPCLHADAVSEDECRGEAIQCRNATTPNRAAVPRMTHGDAQGSPNF